jgi:transcriptional regulator with XRE-family HTH domain
VNPPVSQEAMANATRFDGKIAGNKIRELRSQVRIERDDVETACGITVTRLAEIEADARGATFEELHKIATVFEYTTAGLQVWLKAGGSF